jgi:uncharacterized surface protein with fasciclin (FAS1) repeats
MPGRPGPIHIPDSHPAQPHGMRSKKGVDMTLTSNRIRTTVALTAAAVAVPLAVGGFAPVASAQSGQGASPTLSTSPGSSASASSSTSGGIFGSGCSSLPKSGAGSAALMARADVATAAATNPQLTALVAALKKAGLVNTLNSAKGITVFAPTNAAFKKISASRLASLLASPSQLKKVLTYHVVGDKRITPGELPNGSFKTLEGSTLTTSGSGSSFTVNKTAHIVCGNIATRNATVYLVDNVLMPPA